METGAYDVTTLQMRNLRLESICGLPWATEVVSTRAGNQIVLWDSQTSALNYVTVFLSSGRFMATDLPL